VHLVPTCWVSPKRCVFIATSLSLTAGWIRNSSAAC
jgi:hypothetical protein